MIQLNQGGRRVPSQGSYVWDAVLAGIAAIFLGMTFRILGQEGLTQVPAVATICLTFWLRPRRTGGSRLN